MAYLANSPNQRQPAVAAPGRPGKQAHESTPHDYRNVGALLPFLILMLLASACQAPRAAAPAGPSSAGASFAGRTLNIVTGGTGGIYIVYGAGLADILSKKM